MERAVTLVDQVRIMGTWTYTVSLHVCAVEASVIFKTVRKVGSAIEMIHEVG